MDWGPWTRDQGPGTMNLWLPGTGGRRTVDPSTAVGLAQCGSESQPNQSINPSISQSTSKTIMQ